MNKTVSQVKKGKFFRAADLILLVLVIASVIGIAVSESRPEGGTVTVYVADRKYGEYPTSVDREIPIEAEGADMIMVIRDGAVKVTHSNCPNKQCTLSEISRQGQSIICLPNKVVIKIQGKSDVDGVT